MMGQTNGRAEMGRAGGSRVWLDPRVQMSYLANEWRLMLRPATLGADTMAGVAVALVALPLSLAIATASGVEPAVGLVTAVVGGIVVALAGGTRLQVSGPAAAMTFLVSEIIAKFGVGGLIVATVLAAACQMIAGALRLGRFVQLIPRPVIAGFLSGIGLTILCTQLPVVLGYEVSHTEEGGALGLLIETLRKASHTNPASLAIGALAGGLLLVVPRISRRLPAPLIAIAAPTLLYEMGGWENVRLLGALPSSFPMPSLPAVPWAEWNELVMAAMAIFVLASLESLLSASVVDSLDKQHETDNDQELIGQGLGNLASALFGGLPVTGVIARSATNIQAGARTRMSAIVHAVLLLVMMFALSPLVARIPRAALAGLLMAVALRMIEVRMLRTLWRSSRSEAAVYLTTAGMILVTDLIVGVPIGLIAALLYVVYELSRLTVRPVPLGETATRAEQEGSGCPSVQHLLVEGPLFFASGFHLRSALNRIDARHCVVLDLDRVPLLDMTGVEVLEEAVEMLRRRGVRVLLARPSDTVLRRLRGLPRDEFPALREVPAYADLNDAFLHATTELGPDDLCPSCRDSGRCAELARALVSVSPLDRTVVPHVRAVVAAPVDGPGPSTSPTPRTACAVNGTAARPSISATAMVDPGATVTGVVRVGEHVSIGPGASVRADGTACCHIGDGSDLQGGVSVHAPRDRVVLVGGSSYALFVGRDVRLTHHSMVHGPCYIGDGCFIGFRATLHDAVVGDGCVVGLGAVVMGVSLAPRRYVGHNAVIDTQEKADALPVVTADSARLLDDFAPTRQDPAATGPAPLSTSIPAPSEGPMNGCESLHDSPACGEPSR